MDLWRRLREGLRRTTEQWAGRVGELLGRETLSIRACEVDEATLETLEVVLLGADVGVAATRRLLEAVRARAGEASLRELLKAELLRILEAADRPAPDAGRPHVTFVVGVNGTGKTTTVGKLAYRLRAAGRQPLICAADTYRAAAIDQIAIWAERAGVDLVRARPGADPAAVVFDALGAARARGCDAVLGDTAGRLHTRTNLMHELGKIRRVAARAVEGAPHEVLLVLDATVGQNGVTQAAEFLRSVGVTGIVLAKLDGTAKGGVAVAIADELRVPIRYVGVGEGIEDLVPFSPRVYVEALFEDTW